MLDFTGIEESHALALLVFAFHGQIIKTQHDILRRHDDWLAVGRAEDVIGRHHQNPRFKLGFKGQRHVNGHLIAIEIGVKGGTNQRVKLNSLTFDQDRLESLNAKTVQGRGPVQHHRMLANDLFENIPDFRTFFLQHALGGFDGRR